LPSDPVLTTKLQSQISKNNSQYFMVLWDLIWLSLLFALLVGVLYIILIQNFPRQMVPIVWIFSGIILITAGILLLADNVR
jgi:hypothetical protein